MENGSGTMLYTCIDCPKGRFERMRKNGKIIRYVLVVVGGKLVSLCTVHAKRRKLGEFAIAPIKEDIHVCEPVA